ncbi:hypothetical protein PFLUV_G00240870 [Perca fluviatilis]|uniref:RING-type E3 ubiquitin transferase n=1 Tax=Perca fluviatilis TaxID=8168 RepID=A0A6A5E3G6_PERFL|nr:hypothetical protein PFLUV_G00240870 [Perca fluviatilis]
MQAFSTLLQRMSARKASKPSPCSAGKSALSEPESQLNKDSESCLQAISSGTRSMSAELAMTSKIPHREKAPLASRLLPAKDHNDHRSERVKHKGLKGSTQASKQTQSRDVLKSNSKMKHLFNKTNVEDVIHPKAETTFAFPANNLNVDDMTTCSDIKERVPSQECQEAREGATAAQNAQSLKDRSKETVCRPKQRLLDESSDEEEGEQCRICHSGESSPTNPLISPCLCSGSMQFVHLDCLKKWIRTKIESGSGPYTVKRCELCMGRLTLDPDTLHLDVYYREQQQQMLGNPDLYDLNDVFGMLRRPRLVHVPIWSLLSNLRRRLLRGRRNPSPQETSDT